MRHEMSITTKDIVWLAGLLEGEGCFSPGSHNPAHCRIQLNMTDEDVVVRASKIMGLVIHRYQPRPPGRKPTFVIYANGDRAVGWMMTLYGLMGQRRQAKIKECLLAWQSYIPQRKAHRKPGKAA